MIFVKHQVPYNPTWSLKFAIFGIFWEVANCRGRVFVILYAMNKALSFSTIALGICSLGFGQVPSPYKFEYRSYSYNFGFELSSQNGSGNVTSSQVSSSANSSYESPGENESDATADYAADLELYTTVKWLQTSLPPISVTVTVSDYLNRAASAYSGISWGEPQSFGPISDASGSLAKSTLLANIGTTIQGDMLSQTIGTNAETSLWGRGDSQNVQGGGRLYITVELSEDGPTTPVLEGGKWYFKQKFKFKGKVLLGSASTTAKTTPIMNPWISYDVSAGSSLVVNPINQKLYMESIR